MCKECKNYVALHNHTHFSLLDGYGTIQEYVAAAKEMGMPAIGLTDHGTASGLYQLIKAAQKEGITPVPGLEFYVAPENPDGAKRKAQVFYGPGGEKAPKYDVSGNGSYTHLTVFAYNNKGLSNLFQLTSLSWKQEHFYTKPRIDTNMLAEHSEGLIVTTGCPSSEVSKRFLLGQDDKAYEYATRLKSIFGDNMYVELMNHEMDDELERILTPKLIKLSKDLNIPCIATNDSHYVNKKDAMPHERMLAIQSDSLMSEAPFHEGGTRFAFSGPEYYVKSYEEMLKLYPAEIAEEALANTITLAEKCKDISLDYNPHLRPTIELPEGVTEAEYLKKLILEGMKKKRGHESEEVKRESMKRINEEFKVIHSNDFISYFLVVHDYIKFAHDNGIPVGVGRGSVGGSEIAYVLDISNTDPIRFDLLFERFLSPGRGSQYQIDYTDGTTEELSVTEIKAVFDENGKHEKAYIHELEEGYIVNHENQRKVIERVFVKTPGSAPDVDTDFHKSRREEVIEYCVNKYGKENVANIITFGTFKAKNSFKNICKVYDIPFALANPITKTIPGPIDGVDPSIFDMLDPTSPRYEESADFRTATEGDNWKEVLEVASLFDGRIRETGIHACGIIIANEPLSTIIPTQVRQKDGKLVTQWTYPELEALGLIKMDFLGLDTLDIIDNTYKNIKFVGKEVPELQEIINGEMNDPKTLELLQRGDTVGVFQLGGNGVRDLLRRAKPTAFIDIANITALYRPGPMKSGSHIQYADRKNGLEEVSYIHPDFNGTEVEEILKETYGLLVFQEQSMLIASRYAGLTPYETDKLRKAIGKKNMAVMMSLQPKFIAGCLEKGASQEAADTLWDTIEVFGQYGFNKSHSVSYAINAYLTAYLKANYPAEFMAALIQQNTGDAKKIALFLQEAQNMGLEIGPVDVNTSAVDVSPAKEGSRYDIVYGFAGVKQVNAEFGEAVIAERDESGAFTSVADFVKRMGANEGVKPGVLGSLALAGAFDEFGVSRKLVVEKASELVKTSVKNVDKGLSLFDLIAVDAQDITESIELVGPDYDYNEKIKLEADRIGLFVSGHPTAQLGHVARSYNPVTIAHVMNKGANRETYNIIGTFTQLASKVKKNGSRSIAVTFDDGDTSVDLFLPKHIVAQIEKGEEIKRIRVAKEKGRQLKETKRSIKLAELVNDVTIKAMDPIELNDVYLVQVRVRRTEAGARLMVYELERLKTAPNGSLPFDIILNNNVDKKALATLVKNNPGETYINCKTPEGDNLIKSPVKLTRKLIRELENIVGRENVLTEGV